MRFRWRGGEQVAMVVSDLQLTGTRPSLLVSSGVQRGGES